MLVSTIYFSVVWLGMRDEKEDKGTRRNGDKVREEGRKKGRGTGLREPQPPGAKDGKEGRGYELRFKKILCQIITNFDL